RSDRIGRKRWLRHSPNGISPAPIRAEPSFTLERWSALIKDAWWAPSVSAAPNHSPRSHSAPRIDLVYWLCSPECWLPTASPFCEPAFSRRRTATHWTCLTSLVPPANWSIALGGGRPAPTFCGRCLVH